MYSYIANREFPPQISFSLPAHVQVQPAFPSGAGPPRLENMLPLVVLLVMHF